MKIFNKLLRILVNPILTFAASTVLAAWLLIQYQQPQVVCYTDESYQKISNLLVGTIFIVNEGRSPANNLSVSIGEKLSISDIEIGYLSAKATILNEDNKTQITIPKLKPNESAEIVFRSRGVNKTFKIEDVTSDSGSIRYEVWIKSWWNFTKFQMGIILLVAMFTFGIGLLIGSIKNPVLKNAKAYRATRK
jgi:hypothetical protein